MKSVHLGLLSKPRVEDEERIKKLLGTFLIFLFMFSFGFSAFQSDQNTYIPYTLARFDSTLFTSDYNVPGMSSGYTTQFFIDLLFMPFLKLGLHWTHICGILYAISLFTFSLGIVYISFLYSKKYFLNISIFVALSIQMLQVGNAFGSNNIWMNSFYNQTPAVALSIWGLYFALLPKPHWLKSSIVLACAGLFHVQVAVYMYVIVFVLALFYVFRTKQFRILFTFIPVFLVAALSLILASQQGEFTLGDVAFNEIYTKLRHPHHLQPSHWSKKGMLQFCIYALTCIPFGVLSADKSERKIFLYKFVFPTCTLYAIAAIAFVVNYVFVEIVPWSLISKMYPERFFGALRLWLIIYLGFCLKMLLKRNKYCFVSIFSMAIFFCGENIYIVLLVACIVLLLQTVLDESIQMKAKGRILENMTFISSGLLLLLCSPMSWYNMTLTSWFQITLFSFVLFALVFLGKAQGLSECKKINLIIMSILASVSIISPYMNLTDYGKLQRVSYSQAFMVPTADESFKAFCELVKQEMPVDAVFLCNPGSGFADNVRLFSERTHVVSWKTVPINDQPLSEYLLRLMDIGYVVKKESGYAVNTCAYMETSVNDLLKYARKYNANYIFIETEEDLKRFSENGGVDITVSVGNWHLAKIR
ncbi:hypothetical protein M2146_002743 [Lachnospiraceae bacterium PF1-22]|uniref:DUF6798 domain-containing protein n=1 Tax=Ohessyouella blattaphilus TaxID=2949333 RepID=UPI003E316E5C